jgi:hypothetical protein
MRKLGGSLLVLGILGFYYAGSRLEQAEPLASGLTFRESLEQQAGRWEMARYLCAGVAGFGLLMAMFPRGR